MTPPARPVRFSHCSGPAFVVPKPPSLKIAPIPSPTIATTRSRPTRPLDTALAALVDGQVGGECG
jgi:hypothetical protein